jgi:Flp pilus assembly protein TadG
MKPPRLRDLVRGRRGTAALDFAMVSVVFLPLCFGIIELGLMLWVQNTLQSTAEFTARCAATENTACSNAQQYAVDTATQYLPSGMVSTGDVTVWYQASCNGAPGSAVIVTIAHTFWESSILPPPYQSLTTSVSSCFATGP